MNLYILKPHSYLPQKQLKNPWVPWYDKNFTIVVRARDEDEARAIASVQPGDEGANAWLDPKYSSCTILNSEGESQVIVCEYVRA